MRLIAWSIRGRSGAPAARPAGAHPRGTPQAREQDRDRREDGARPPAALAGFYRDNLHGKEARLAAIGAEVSRVRECAGAPHRVAEAAMALVRRHIYDLEGLSAGAAAVAALWLAARDLGGPRPLGDFLRCSRADRSAVKRAAWRLNEAARGRRPPIEEYVKTVAARANLPAPVVRRALEILEENRKAVVGRNPLGPGRGGALARHVQGVRDADAPGECGRRDHRGRQGRREEDEGMSSDGAWTRARWSLPSRQTQSNGS